MKPKMFDINKLIRNNIKALKPYSSARDEYKGKDAIFLDANENPFNNPYNRYPDPLHSDLREKIAVIKGVKANQIFLGNGSDEPIDLLIRAFCEPRIDNIVSVDPTYGMYKVCADINDVEYREACLKSDFQLDVETLLNLVDGKTKLIYLCSPNNPTGNSINESDIINVIEHFSGIVVLDEAYIDFSEREGFLSKIDKFENLVILQTFSKAWGLAGIRFGMAFGNQEIIKVLYKIKYPYNLNALTQKLALEFLDKHEEREVWLKTILSERERMKEKLKDVSLVNSILPTDANFLMIRVDEPKKIYDYLVSKQIIIRDRSKVTLCEGCLRVTIGNERENNAFIEAIQNYK